MLDIGAVLNCLFWNPEFLRNALGDVRFERVKFFGAQA
jgi:hypothetical protein